MRTVSKISLCVMIALISAGNMASYAQTKNNKEVAKFISTIHSPRNFTDGTIPDDVIKAIVESGIKAPSARNLQPWHFIVVSNSGLVNEIIPNSNPGNIVIVICGQDIPDRAAAISLDCGLATENIFIAAQAMGLGSRIYTMPIQKINKELKEKISIPEGYIAVSTVRIGKLTDGADANSGATPRKSYDEMVTYKK